VLDYVILPKVMSRGVMLPPVAVLFGILAGEQIAGVTGMFLSIPFLAAIRVVWVCYRRATEQA
jgi:predicted PurR-regulated permease PerM